MRNLKKLLALVLALMMVVSVMVTVNAAYSDSESIADDYQAAVSELTKWGVMEGMSKTVFSPKTSITRAQMAAIVYRLMTGDTAGYGHDNSAIFAPNAAQFTDLNKDAWYVGYIGYCTSQGIVVGRSSTVFDPDAAINANEVLTMLLRCMGLGKRGEYTGVGYEISVAADAKRFKLTEKITRKLNLVSERQEVAQMTYQAAIAPRQTWSESEQDYIPYVSPNDPSSTKNIPLVRTETVSAVAPKADVWGAPTGGKTSTTKVFFTYPVPEVSHELPTTNAYPMKWDTWDAVTECQMATALNDDGEHWAITYTNGVGNVNLWNGNDVNTTPMPFEATDTVNKIGHEGRHTMVYVNPDFKSSVAESATNPKYIFVFVDTYLGVVTSTWDEVTDPAGHVVREAGAMANVYYNNQAVGTGSTASAFTNAAPLSIEVEGDFTVGQKIGVNMTNGTGTTPAANVATATKSEFQNTVALSTATVTIQSITKDADTSSATGGSAQRIVGIYTTGGARYFYNYTFAGTVLQDGDIGKEVILTLDSQGNILDWAYTGTIGYGVTLSATVKQVSLTEWVLTYEILKPDGQTTTIDVGQPANGTSTGTTTAGAPFTTQNDGSDATDATWYGTNTAGAPAGTLVYYSVPAGAKYYALTKDNVTGISLKDNTVKSGRPAALSKSYTADPVRGDATAIANGTLVDDTTVFFVAEYAPNNVTVTPTNDYTMTGYKVYTGFKTIPDLTSLTGAVSDVDGTTSLATLAVTAFDVDPATGAPKTPAAGQVAKYVLIKNAVKQSKPATIPTVDYAYLITNDLFVDVGANTFKYPAIINGRTGRSLEIKLDGSNPLKDSGLYTYTDWVNGSGYTDVRLLNAGTGAHENAYTTDPLKAPYNGDFEIDAGYYVYANGVLTALTNKVGTTGDVTYANSDGPYAVAADCAVYLVNPTTGAATERNLGMLSVFQYTYNCDMWYQLDANGYISLIYIIESADVTPPARPNTTTFDISLGSANAPSAAHGESAVSNVVIESTGTANAATGTAYNYTATVSVWTTGIGWVEFSTGKGTGTVGTNLTSVNTGIPLPAAGSVVKVSVTATCGGKTSSTVEFSFATT